MQPTANGFSVVIVGKWNPAIFTPQWVAENLLDQPNGDNAISLAFPIGNTNAPTQLRFSGVRMFPGTERLDFRPEEPTPESMCFCVLLARRCLEILQHTPVSASGINFAYDVSDESEALGSFMKFADAANINSEVYEWSTSLLNRSFNIRAGSILNLTLQYGRDVAQVDLNFHTDISNANEGVKLLTDDVASERHQESLVFLRDVYGIE